MSSVPSSFSACPLLRAAGRVALCLVAGAAACAAPTQDVHNAAAATRPEPGVDRSACTLTPSHGAADPEGWRRADAWLALCGDDLIATLTTQLVAHPTVSAQQSPKDGPAFLAMRQDLSTFAAQWGWRFAASGDNDAWEIGFGKGAPLLLVVTHGDVVPAAEKEDGADLDPTVTPPDWHTPPFVARRDGDKLYGRGSEDDKGPIAAMLVLFAALDRFGVDPGGELVLAIGTGEEHDWDGMERYAAVAPKARHVISVDAGFPVVAAQSGFVSWHLTAPAEPATPGKKPRLRNLHAGHFLTQVPGEARVEILPPQGSSLTALRSLVEAAAKGINESVEISEQAAAGAEPARLVVMARGKAVHSSTAEDGDNALWRLSRVVDRLDTENDGRRAVLRLVAQRLAGDHYGEKLGLAYSHPFMGKLLVVPTVLRETDGKVTLSINMRRPAGKTSDEFRAALAQTLAAIQRDIDPRLGPGEEGWVGEAHLADTSTGLVPTLLEVYRSHMNAPDAKAIAIRGGTYARLFKGAVDFGPALPDAEYRGHAPDEFVELPLLTMMARMIGAALPRLAEP